MYSTYMMLKRWCEPIRLCLFDITGDWWVQVVIILRLEYCRRSYSTRLSVWTHPSCWNRSVGKRQWGHDWATRRQLRVSDTWTMNCSQDQTHLEEMSFVHRIEVFWGTQTFWKNSGYVIVFAPSPSQGPPICHRWSLHRNTLNCSLDKTFVLFLGVFWFYFHL